VLGPRTERNLIGVHPDLVRGVRLAITLTPVDFGILDGGGVRTAGQARANADAGVGGADSTHSIQPDGLRHAVAVVAVEAAQPSTGQASGPRLRRARTQMQESASLTLCTSFSPTDSATR